MLGLLICLQSTALAAEQTLTADLDLVRYDDQVVGNSDQVAYLMMAQNGVNTWYAVPLQSDVLDGLNYSWTALLQPALECLWEERTTTLTYNPDYTWASHSLGEIPIALAVDCRQQHS